MRSPVLAHGDIKWTYAEFYDDTIKKGRFYPSFYPVGATSAEALKPKAQTAAQTPATWSKVTPYRELILPDDHQYVNEVLLSSSQVAHTPSMH